MSTLSHRMVLSPHSHGAQYVLYTLFWVQSSIQPKGVGSILADNPNRVYGLDLLDW